MMNQALAATRDRRQRGNAAPAATTCDPIPMKMIPLSSLPAVLELDLLAPAGEQEAELGRRSSWTRPAEPDNPGRPILQGPPVASSAISGGY
jgi:hypothetical protein